MSDSLIKGVSGNSIINCEYNGKFIIDCVEKLSLLSFQNADVYTYTYDEDLFRINKIKLLGIEPISSSETETIFIKTNFSTIEVSPKSLIMVNEAGEFKWKSAEDIKVDDLVLTPKYFHRNEFRYDINELFSNPIYSVENKQDGTRIITNSESTESLYLTNHLNTSLLNYLLGCLESSGVGEIENGKISYYSTTSDMAGVFSFIMADLFALEPSWKSLTTKYKFRLESNSVMVCNILKGISANLFNQEDEVFINYLSGIIDSLGKIKGSKLVINVEGLHPLIISKISKCFNVLGVICPMPDKKNNIIIDSTEDIMTIVSNMDIRREDISLLLVDILNSSPRKNNQNVGYKFGKLLSQDMKQYNVNRKDLNITSQNLTNYEKDLIVPFQKAIEIAEIVQRKIDPINQKIAQKSLSNLVCADVVGTRVTDITKTKRQKVFGIHCEDNCNFFINDILCSN